MHHDDPLGPDRRLYFDLGFDRAELFAFLQRRGLPGHANAPAWVLYPGCSVHLTPALYFSDVTFAHRGPQAEAFFAKLGALRAWLHDHRTYRAPPRPSFLAWDYTSPRPELDGTFDVVLALHAPDVATCCARYLRPGGVLLSNSFMGDAERALDTHLLEFVAALRGRRGRYEFLPVKAREALNRPHKRDDLRERNGRLTFEDTATYVVLRQFGAHGGKFAAHGPQLLEDGSDDGDQLLGGDAAEGGERPVVVRGRVDLQDRTHGILDARARVFEDVAAGALEDPSVRLGVQAALLGCLSRGRSRAASRARAYRRTMPALRPRSGVAAGHSFVTLNCQ